MQKMVVFLSVHLVPLFSLNFLTITIQKNRDFSSVFPGFLPERQGPGNPFPMFPVSGNCPLFVDRFPGECYNFLSFGKK
jgi:hypothetical protein